MAQQLPSLIGEMFLPSLFLEKTYAHLLLQALHVLSHRRLRARQLHACFGEAVVVNHCDKSAQ
jgi:hypothetical protein